MDDATKFYDASKNDASKTAGQVCVESFGNSPFVEVQLLREGEFHFRDPRGFRYTDELPFRKDMKKKLASVLDRDAPLLEEVTGGVWLPKWYTETLVADGIGTKVELANALYSLVSQIEWKHGRHVSGFRQMAANLIAMSADDIARFGGLPLVYANVIDYSKLTDENAVAYRELMLGLWDIMKKIGLVGIGWESAKLAQFIGSENPEAFFPFNWSWVMQGVYHDKLNITGENVAEWDYIVVLGQWGVRSNGLTKMREAIAIWHGPEWWNNPEALADVEEALTPSVVYARLIAEANGWYTNGQKEMQITGIGHISGGGLGEKVLPLFAHKWLSARLDNLFAIPGIAGRALHWLNRDKQSMSLENAFGTWCMGQWMAVTFKTQEEAEKFIALAHHERHRIKAQIAGRVMVTPKSKNPHLQVTARFEEDSTGKEIFIEG